MDLPLAYGLRLAWQSADDRLEERAWLYFCTTAPYQDKKHRTSFEEMMRKLRLPSKDKKSNITAEQLEKYDKIFKQVHGNKT